MKKEKERAGKTRSVVSLDFAIVLVAMTDLVLVQIKVFHWLIVVGCTLQLTLGV